MSQEIIDALCVAAFDATMEYHHWEGTWDEAYPEMKELKLQQVQAVLKRLAECTPEEVVQLLRKEV